MTTAAITNWLTGRRKTSEGAGPYTITVSGPARRELETIASANRLGLAELLRQTLVMANWLHHETEAGATLEIVRRDGTRETVRWEGITMKAARFRLPF